MSKLIKNHDIGYVAAIFSAETRDRLDMWVRNAIPNDMLFTMKVNGTLEGGNVARKAHLTIFFGINDQSADKNGLSKLIHAIAISDLIVRGVSSFKIPNIPCKTLHLVIDDHTGELQRAHDKFLVVPHFEDCQEPRFVPHITLAYVKDDFDERKLQDSYIQKLHVKEIAYRIKS